MFAIPLMFVMLLGIIQYGLWAHAHHRAQAIATEALAAGRAFQGSEGEGRTRGYALAEDLGGTVLRDLRIQVQRRDGTARVSVDGVTVSLLPGWSPSVSATLTGPIERPVGGAP
ncbi:TadE/TadG family type IV pilus assembly protein [Nocardiopsis sp. NPDC050513]|uniref:TadE/TadG family type IV pilus assembly protein n=1 Tax=Nocardiopsis sp. NPDC050513 TaxID=3364338 RepID=UPI00379CD5BF